MNTSSDPFESTLDLKKEDELTEGGWKSLKFLGNVKGDLPRYAAAAEVREASSLVQDGGNIREVQTSST